MTSSAAEPTVGHSPTAAVALRRARTPDVKHMAQIIRTYAQQQILLDKEWVTLYEDIQEFRVATTDDDTVIGCGALHVMWEDIAEVRTLAVAPAWRKRKVGHQLLQSLLQQAREIGVSRVFCLTFEVDFFTRHGFRALEEVPVDSDTYAQLRRSMDQGVAEFLDLAWVKPNTLGNTRMLCEL